MHSSGGDLFASLPPPSCSLALPLPNSGSIPSDGKVSQTPLLASSLADHDQGPASAHQALVGNGNALVGNDKSSVGGNHVPNVLEIIAKLTSHITASKSTQKVAKAVTMATSLMSKIERGQQARAMLACVRAASDALVATMHDAAAQQRKVASNDAVIQAASQLVVEASNAGPDTFNAEQRAELDVLVLDAHDAVELATSDDAFEFSRACRTLRERLASWSMPEPPAPSAPESPHVDVPEEALQAMAIAIRAEAKAHERAQQRARAYAQGLVRCVVMAESRTESKWATAAADAVVDDLNRAVDAFGRAGANAAAEHAQDIVRDAMRRRQDRGAPKQGGTKRPRATEGMTTFDEAQKHVRQMDISVRSAVGSKTSGVDRRGDNRSFAN